MNSSSQMKLPPPPPRTCQDVEERIQTRLGTLGSARSTAHTGCLRYLAETWRESSKGHSKSNKTRFQMTTVARGPRALEIRGPASRLPHSRGPIGARRRLDGCEMAHVSGRLSGSAAGGRNRGPQSSLNPHPWDPVQPAQLKGHRETCQEAARKGTDRRLESTETSVAPEGVSGHQRRQRRVPGQQQVSADELGEGHSPKSPPLTRLGGGHSQVRLRGVSHLVSTFIFIWRGLGDGGGRSTGPPTALIEFSAGNSRIYFPELLAPPRALSPPLSH